MRVSAGTRQNILLALSSSVLTLLLFVLGYELWQNIRYRAWRARYDNKGWLGTVTVPSSDPVLMWEYRPYGHHRSIETNRYGFRDEDFASPRKPAGTWRVAFIGDSVTLGLGVAANLTFVRRCEADARALAPGLDVQALNFGIDGYNTIQIAELLRIRVLSFEPDRVVYVMCLNDFDQTDSSAEKIRYFRKPRSFLWEDLSTLYRRLRGIEFHRYHFERTRTATFAEVLSMQRVLAARRTSFLLVILPVFFEGRHDFTDYPLRDIHEEIRRFCERNDIEVYDLLDSFAGSGKDATGYALDPWHLSEEGHRLVAIELAPRVLPRGTTQH